MTLTPTDFARRRAALAARLPAGSLLLLPAATTRYRNRDAEYPFRQHSDFLYLCGFPEPDAWLALKVTADGFQSVLFVLPRDPEKEIWNGYRAGPAGAVSDYGVDAAHELQQLDLEVVKLLADCEAIYYPFADRDAAERVMSWRRRSAEGSREAATVAQALHNLEPLLHSMRLVKDPQEQQLMREAGRISADAHLRAMQACRPGLHEYHLQAEIEYHFARQGCRSPAYATIVGGGANGCILHYTENQDLLQSGDLVLIDAGCEHQGYAGDITRTFPVNGRFSDPQRELYQLVLDAQLAAISEVRPGAHFNRPHERAVEVLTAGLLELGLLSGELAALIADEAYRPFYMHRTSHWLGLDVHDVGDYKQGGEWRLLEPGMVLTIEPGLYVAPDNAQVDARWRGIGIRIEDDVLVTASGCEILTAAAPKTIAEIEQLMAGAT
ncbi:Xaa-Pro aminopeptidase [Motiliproteus sediminis]|uniref:Xaa-Pro aminopeptidase n=1 Tax=Motiliproteus sediminis TaxID=1468178 RepID=UPI001AEF571A|nr:Xaa-Pro aminopeptidase [Motiliproteus sediminis]